MKKRKKQMAVVCCNGGGRTKMKVERSSLGKDCAQIAASHPHGIAECVYGCLGGGSCVEACRKEAICITPEHMAKVDREKCIGCGLCVKACPQKIIRLTLTENSIAPLCSNRDSGANTKKQCEIGCIACRLCEKNCPADAVAVIDNCAVINQERCVSCGMCAVKCPRGVIVDADGIFTATA